MRQNSQSVKYKAAGQMYIRALVCKEKALGHAAQFSGLSTPYCEAETSEKALGSDHMSAVEDQ
jgi:hypothetical protein